MITYTNHKKYIKERSRRARLTTFSGIDERASEHVLPIRYVGDMVGMETESGKIRSAIGISSIKAQDGSEYRDMKFAVDNIYPFYLKGRREIILSSGGRAYKLNEEKKLWAIVPSTYFSGRNSAMFTVGEEPCVIIPDRDDGLVSYNGTAFTSHSLGYTVATMVTHMNRLYVVATGDEYRLRFSTINDPFNFAISLEHGGEIYLDVEDGKILKLISHDGNLYIFREYGVYKLTAFADQREFRVKKIATTTTKIDGESIAVAGGAMLLRTEDGMYTFDGYNMNKMLDNMPTTMANITTSIGIFFAGYYYLSYKTADSGDMRHLMRFNVKTHDIVIVKNANIRAFSIIRSTNDREVLAVAMDGVHQLCLIDDGYAILDDEIDRHWRSGSVDFDMPAVTKELVSFVPNMTDRYTLTVEVDGKYRFKYEVDGRCREYYMRLRGYSFVFTIEPSTRGYITPPIIEYKV